MMCHVVCLFLDTFSRNFRKRWFDFSSPFWKWICVCTSGEGGWVVGTGLRVTQLYQSELCVSRLPWCVVLILSRDSTAWQERWPRAAPSLHPHTSWSRRKSQEQRSPLTSGTCEMNVRGNSAWSPGPDWSYHWGQGLGYHGIQCLTHCETSPSQSRHHHLYSYLGGGGAFGGLNLVW